MSLRGDVRALIWGALWLFACSSDPEAMGRRALGGAAESAAQACRENATEACTCMDGAPGRRVCTARRWQACECSGGINAGQAGAGAPTIDVVGRVHDPLAGNKRTDITFEWTRSEPDEFACEAGHYEGSFAGLYYSRLNWPIPFPITGVDLPGLPGLQFDMMPAKPGETTLEVNGKFDGLADGLFPFRGDFVGELNCNWATSAVRRSAASFRRRAGGAGASTCSTRRVGSRRRPAWPWTSGLVMAEPTASSSRSCPTEATISPRWSCAAPRASASSTTRAPRST
jgi:hypothetical protein